MAACEKCWSDAFMASMNDPSVDQVEHYHRLLKERKDNPCTSEEQCGEMHLILDHKDGSKRCRCGKHAGERKAR